MFPKALLAANAQRLESDALGSSKLPYNGQPVEEGTSRSDGRLQTSRRDLAHSCLSVCSLARDPQP